MTSRRDEGSWAWKQRQNHNHMMALQVGALQVGALQAGAPAAGDAVELAYFGGSAFRITTPAGLTVMIDPWRNPPWGNWDWYLQDFPAVEVDVGVSTHAHFDHDGLHALSAHVLLDRMVGTYAFADLRITGIADKHVSDSSHNAYDWAQRTRELTEVGTRPPDNWRSFDNVMMLVETAGLRILHWGDNRPDPPEHVWAMLGQVDVALLPADGSWHVLSEAQVEAVAARLGREGRGSAPLCDLGSDDARLDAAAAGRMGERAGRVTLDGGWERAADAGGGSGGGRRGAVLRGTCGVRQGPRTPHGSVGFGAGRFGLPAPLL